MSEKILVIHQGALGDVILSFPAILALKQQKNACISLLCNHQIGKMAHELMVVDAHFSIESARFCSLFSKAISHDMKYFIDHYETVLYIGFSDEIADQVRQNHRWQTCQITPRPPAEEETHVAVHIMRQLQDKGLLGKIKMRAPSSCQPAVKQIQNQRQERLLLIHPGAGSKRKRWSLKNFVEVADAITRMNSREAVFVIGPAESDLLPIVKNQVEGRFRVRQFEDLTEVMAFMKAANCFIGNDSGLTHLSAFMGVPTVAIFGPSSPNRWAPIGPATKVLRGKVDCAACFEVEKRNCEVPQCLNGVSVDMVVDAVKELA